MESTYNNPKYIEIENLCVRYGGKHKKEVLKGLNLTVRKGQVYGFLGPNGAGKTTAIKTMVGLIPEYTGRVLILDRPPQDLSAKQKIGFMPEIANYYWYLTAREALHMYARIFGINKKQATAKTEELLDLVGLKDSANVLMKTFSKGMMQKLSFAQALINDPELLILDEPMGGLDPVSRIKMRDVIKRLHKEGKTIFFSSHELSEIEMICDEIAIIKDGALLKSGKLHELLSQKGESIALERYFLNIIGDKVK
ncbi:MAG: ABC transporter ATP-binding protein [Candidatus Omnitrophica bacterium]|nr:ABC transporter ATP-binding protein [Candidatus Omnitrophota bacterium]